MGVLMKKGILIVLEGGDGCGKTTVLNKIKEDYKDFVFTKEPGDTPIGKRLRELIFEFVDVDPITQCYLFATDRAEHIAKVIKPALQAKKVIICDRFIHSSLAYQGRLPGMTEKIINRINKAALGKVKPDLVVFLKTDKSFRTNIENSFDVQTETQRNQLTQAFVEMSKNKKNNMFTIDVTNKDADTVYAIVKIKIEEVLRKYGN